MTGLYHSQLPGRNRISCDCASFQHGFTLIEILVTMAIMSVALVGMAGMDMFTYRKNNDAFFRAQATFQAYEMAARMQANAKELAKQNPVQNGYKNITGSGVSPPTPNCLDRASTTKSAASAIDCSESEIAAFDADEWLYSTASLLPAGSGSVIAPTSSSFDGVYTITVSWKETVSAQENTTKTFVYEFSPLP